MKILFISSGNASSGGVGVIVKNQSESLIKSGVEIDYYPIKGKGLFSYLRHIAGLRTFLKGKQYDVCHAHYSLSGVTAALAGCRPLVVSLMGSDVQSGFFWKTIIHLMSRFFWQSVVVKSEAMKQEIGLPNALVIPNGIDCELVKPTENKRQASFSKPILLFAADPSRYAKNYELAEQVVAQLRGEVELKVVFNRPHAEIVAEINRADVLLLSSRWEGSPNIVKEAMACNCPVVATNVGDVAWLFGNEPGYFLTSFDPNDVADKIRQALDFAQQQGRTNGRQRIMKLGLDAETVAQRLIGVYEGAMEKTKTGKC